MSTAHEPHQHAADDQRQQGVGEDERRIGHGCFSGTNRAPSAVTSM